MNIQLKVILTMVMLVWLSTIEVNAQQADDDYPTIKPTRQPTRPKPQKRTVNTSSQIEEKITVNGVSFKMVYVEGGKFTMGATNDQDNNCFTDEYPGHDVTISSFKIGETEVTQELWQAVMGSNPSYFKGPRLPVEKVSWEDCQTFIKKLNTLTGRNFRLPTEAEWEYAARGGKKSDDYLFSGSSSINDVAWFSANSGTRTHDVATSRSNGLGLYDMSGNVNEWCQDWYDSCYYSKGASSNPTGPSSATRRVVRGGSWQISDRYCRVLYRHSRKPTDSNFGLGLRLALSGKVTLHDDKPTRTNTSSSTNTTNTVCGTCRGKGYIQCSSCHGKGTRSNLKTCSTCNGRGEVLCSRCRGTGKR